MRAAVLRYRVMAYVTGVVLVVLCFVGIPLQVAGHPAVANDVGVVHGILYIIYLVCAWILSRKLALATKPMGATQYGDYAQSSGSCNAVLLIADRDTLGKMPPEQLEELHLSSWLFAGPIAATIRDLPKALPTLPDRPARCSQCLNAAPQAAGW